MHSQVDLGRGSEYHRATCGAHTGTSGRGWLTLKSRGHTGWVQDARGAAAIGAGRSGRRGAPRGAPRRRVLPLAGAAAAAHSSQLCTNCFSRCSPAEMRVREKWVQQQPVPGLTLRTVLSR